MKTETITCDWCGVRISENARTEVVVRRRHPGIEKFAPDVPWLSVESKYDLCEDCWKPLDGFLQSGGVALK